MIVLADIAIAFLLLMIYRGFSVPYRQDSRDKLELSKLHIMYIIYRNRNESANNNNN